MRKANTVIDAKRQAIVCLNCEEAVPIPLGSVKWFAAYARAFDAAHRECRVGMKVDHPIAKTTAKV